MSPYLAGEITDHIIGFVWPDKQGLCACSLVCHDWLPASRHHLFSSITTSPASYDKLVEQLNQSSSMRACLPSVCTFTFQVPILTQRYSDEPSFVQRFILDFSGHLPNLRRAEFSSALFSKNMHPRSHLALRNFWTLQELSLMQCHFDAFTSLRRILVALPALTSLAMKFPSWASTSSPSVPIRPPDQTRPVLECLSLGLMSFQTPDYDSLMNWLISLPTPRRISLCIWGVHKEGIDSTSLGALRFMSCLSSPAAVRDLVISPFEAEGNHVDLSVLVNLENLELCLTDAVYPTWPVRWDVLCRMLEAVRSPLRHFRIAVDIMKIQLGKLDPAVLDGMEALDPVLESEAFRHIKAVAFVTIGQYFSSPDHAPFDEQSMRSEGYFLEAVRTKLPKLYARGITKFD